MNNSRSTALLFTFLFAAISVSLISYHEMWRDELQPWLLARDSPSVPELFNNLKYEGHSGLLWQLILYALTRIFDTPVAMQYLHVGIATASIFVLIRWSPFTTLQKILFCFSYFLFYEYSIISRNYALGVLLIFLICAMFPKRREFPLVVAGALFFLSHTSALGLIFALCLFSAIMFEEVVVRGRDVKRRRLTATDVAAMTIASIGFITAIILDIPPADSGMGVEWRFFPNLKAIYAPLVGAYFPLPKFSLSFWNSRAFVSSMPLRVLILPTLAGLIYAVCRFLVSRPAALFLYAAVSSALLLFFHTLWSSGSLRHHGFLFLALIAASWIYNYCDSRIFQLTSKLLKPLSYKVFNALFSVVLLMHVVAGVMAGYLDYKYPFSAAKETAYYLERNGYSDQTIIGHISFAASAVAGHMHDKKFYYADGNRYGTFIIWDKARLNNVGHDYLSTTSAKLASLGKDVILVLNYKIEDLVGSSHEFNLLFESSMSIVSDEKFYVYRYLVPATKVD